MQSILTQAIVVFVWIFVFSFLFDLINGLFRKAEEIRFNCSVTRLQFAPVVTPVFEEIPNPWDAEVEVVNFPSASCPLPPAFVPALPPAKELPLIVQIETEVKAIAWNHLKRIISDYKLSAKGKRDRLEKTLLEFCQSRNEVQLQTILQYMRGLAT